MKRMQKVVVLAAVIALGLTAAANSVFAADLPELLALADKIKNENPGIELEIGTDKKEYQTGEPVAFEFKANKDCYLSLIDIGTSGRALILFPNKWHGDNKIEKGKVYKIPPQGADFAYKVEGPAGTERVKVIACVEPILINVESLQQELRTPLAQSPSQGGTFLSMKNPEMVLKDIGMAFVGVDQTKWATATLEFKIAAAGPPPAPQAAPEPSAPPAGAPQATPPADAPQPAAEQGKK